MDFSFPLNSFPKGIYIKIETDNSNNIFLAFATLRIENKVTLGRCNCHYAKLAEAFFHVKVQKELGKEVKILEVSCKTDCE